MKTKSIPALITLIAGLVACISGILGHMGTGDFVKMLLAVLVIFYIIGCIVKIILDKNFPEMKDEGEEGEETSEDGEAAPDGDGQAQEDASGEDEEGKKK